MRLSTIATAAFAAGAIAGPVNFKRAYVTEVTYTTVTIYVTPGQEVPTPTQTPAVQAYTKSRGPWTKHKTSTVYSSSVVAVPAPSSEAPAPVYSSVEAPAPATSEAAYTAPAYSSAAAEPSATGLTATYLYHHNVHRSNHSASDLVWNQTLADSAEVLARTCTFAHNTTINGGGYGQNLAASSPDANTASLISDGWYNGEAPNFDPYYGEAQPDMSTFESYGHFTQLVWKGTQSVGCYTLNCATEGNTDFKMWYTVCNYYPPGNFATQYANNVARPNGNPTVHG